MKRFLLGLCCGAALASSTLVYASDEIRAALFPVQFEFNGEKRETPSRFAVLNYNGHTYVPLRYMAENLGAGAAYREEDNTVSVVSEPSGADEAAKRIWAARYRLERGMTSKEVREALGEPSFSALLDSSRQQWRYDIGAKSDYKNNGGVSADTEALHRGDLQAQVFVSWNASGEVDRYELWSAVSTENGARAVQVHIVYPDGSSSTAAHE
ncbi:stalk domain-containing protein [Paenibacillus sp. KR2-11]|uniref:stalk domain-containing protein n=1 Tax=Paenibacillus sp. KR2-11 TaxID=3385500 RepID=UPI0038FC675A